MDTEIVSFNRRSYNIDFLLFDKARNFACSLQNIKFCLGGHFGCVHFFTILKSFD